MGSDMQHTTPAPSDIGAMKQRWHESLIDWLDHAVECPPCRPMDRRSGCSVGFEFGDRELRLARAYTAAVDADRQRILRVVP